MIVDAHAHIFDVVDGRTAGGATRSLDQGRIRWGEQELQLTSPCAGPTTFTPEMLLAHMDSASVEKAVLLQGSFYGEKNAYVADAVRRWPDRFVGAAFVDPRGADPEAVFRRCFDHEGFRILKLELSVATGLVGLYPDLRVDGSELAWVWEEAERRGLVVTLDLGAVGSASYQTEAVRAVIERHPSLTVVVAHLAQPPVGRWTEALDALWHAQVGLARFPNVWLDLSSLPAYAAVVEDYPFPTSLEYVRRAVELVGPDKLLWGTDAPGVLSAATYRQLLTWLIGRCDFLTEEELAAVTGKTAERVYLSAR